MQHLSLSQPQTFDFAVQSGAFGHQSVLGGAGRPGRHQVSLSALSCTTQTSGAQAGSCSVSLVATVAGWYTVSASLGGIPLGNPAGGQVSAQFLAGPVSVANSVLSIDNGPKLANGSDAYTLTVSAQDAFGNLQSGQALLFTFSAPGSGASLSALSCATATTGPSAGTCSVSLTATAPGQYQVSAFLNGVGLGVPVGGQVSAVFSALPTPQAIPLLDAWGRAALVLLMLAGALVLSASPPARRR